jgi:hypothetical protein
MDETETPEGDDDAPPPPPTAFGVPARPLGCGLLGGALFAFAVAPAVLMAIAPNPCFNFAADCPWPPEGTGLGLAITAWAGTAFGLATGWLVARRVASWRAGRSVRPALWVAFVALFALAWGPGSLALSLLLGLAVSIGG